MSRLCKQPMLAKQSGQPAENKGETGMGRLIKIIFGLVILGFAGLTGYAFLADLSPPQQEISVPVTLDAD